MDTANLPAAYKNKAMPIAPPINATASAPRLRLLILSAPFCNFGVAVLLATADVAVCCSITAKLVIVVNCPLGSCVVSRTRLWTTPPPGVYVVMKVLPLASVAVRVAPETALVNTTELPEESLVVMVLGAATFTVEATTVVATPFDVTTAAGTEETVVTALPLELVVVTVAATLTDAVTTAEVVNTVADPAESVVESVNEVTMTGAGVEVVVGTTDVVGAVVVADVVPFEA
jgi:hypothetical protein